MRECFVSGSTVEMTFKIPEKCCFRETHFDWTLLSGGLRWAAPPVMVTSSLTGSRDSIDEIHGWAAGRLDRPSRVGTINTLHYACIGKIFFTPKSHVA